VLCVEPLQLNRFFLTDDFPGHPSQPCIERCKYTIYGAGNPGANGYQAA
jgi:hypothetical protein